MIDTLVDGRPADRVPADDRGLLYGDQLFETMAFFNGRAPLWPWHWQRLSRDARRLGLAVPREHAVAEDCRRLAADRSACIIRVALTRGSGPAGYRPPDSARGRRIVQRRDWPEGVARMQRDGLRVHTSPVRLATGSVLAGIKHGNRLEQVLAARYCAATGCDEALVYDASDRLVEGISSNVILVIDGRALTPALDGAGVAGVGLSWLGEQPGCRLETAGLNAADVARCDEIMMINSVAGIRPVVAVDDQPFAAGSWCRNWQRLWTERLTG